MHVKQHEVILAHNTENYMQLMHAFPLITEQERSKQLGAVTVPTSQNGRVTCRGGQRYGHMSRGGRGMVTCQGGGGRGMVTCMPRGQG